jgi:hypothetical protein
MSVGDRVAIGDLVGRYADAVNLVDADLWGSTWAAECIWELGPDRLLRGRNDVVAHWRQAMASFESVIQIVAHGSACVDDAGAIGRWTLFEVNQREAPSWLTVGCYEDRYVRDDTRGWLFAERHFTVTYRGGLPDGAFSPFPPLSEPR